MKYVLDTNVVSAIRNPRKNPTPAAWVARIPLSELYITTPTVAELGLGVAAKERTDPTQGKVFRDWFDLQVLAAFGDRILPFDLAAAQILSTYRVPEHAPYDDALIAAIAQANNMTIVTRNIKHFQPLGVACINPWETTTTRRVI